MDQNSLPCIDEIKQITKQIVKQRAHNRLPLTSEYKDVMQQMNDISFKLFSYVKLDHPNYTVCNDSYLRKVRIDKDSDGISDNDLLEVTQRLENNIEAFHQLITKVYIQSVRKKGSIGRGNYQLYYGSLFSLFCSSYEDVFFVTDNGRFSIFNDKVINISLVTYIEHYFGSVPEQIKQELEEMASSDYTHDDMQLHFIDVFSRLSEHYVLSRHSFIEGAISFFDFLGWKGLWLVSKDNHPLEDINSIIESIDMKLKQETKLLFPDSVGECLSRLISISDTIAFFTPKTPYIQEIQLLELHANVSRFILESTAMKNYPIRGAISYGKYSILNSVMIGPGIDECASWFEQSDWIGAHFTPSSQLILNQNEPFGDEKNFIRYKSIPLKNAPKLDYCVKWTIDDQNFDRLVSKAQPLLPEIASKYIHTREFLVSGKEH